MAYFSSQNPYTLTPFFRILDDFDNYSRHIGEQQHGRRCAVPTWQPKFDIRETADNYELHGELAGVSKDNVHIEFTEPQTMLVRGKVERTYSTRTPPTSQIEDAAGRGAIAEGEEPKSSHQATVEDDIEYVNTPTESTADAVVERQKTEEKRPVDKAKYWLTERRIGEFSRSFNFPGRVDQDTVTASFNDGVLTIVVPKAKPRESRRIAII
ncbi:30 kDa heat shock protein [Tolypocladium capitatum]|uniref:30 kDa heat shock protein n=1 Tax=Tolypocladium capitatum TaxID=45235 RepID=A0A2K3QBA4_9HYPO|nr:30 kDa heat shock protein [Tolypocladium capitatum]